MDIVIGSGKSRKTVTLPSVAAARNSNAALVEREQGFDALKSFLFRPALLKS